MQIEQIAEDFCGLIRYERNTEGKILFIDQLARRLGLEVMCALVLGRRMGFLLPEYLNDTSRQLAYAVQNHFLACRDTYFGLPLWKIFPTKAYKLLVKSDEAIYDIVSQLVSTADESVKESVIFQSILGANIDEKEKTVAIVDFISSGIQTLGNTFIFMLHSVGMRRDLQDKILTEETKESYLKACRNETFRLLPTANCLARVTEKDLELSGYTIKSGSVVICQTGLACRDTRNFSNPNMYIPERWLNEEKISTQSNATYLVIPFGCGRRTCPGKRFIKHTLPILLDRIVQNFAFESDEELDVQFEFLMTPKSPVKMTFTDRF